MTRSPSYSEPSEKFACTYNYIHVHISTLKYVYLCICLIVFLQDGDEELIAHEENSFKNDVKLVEVEKSIAEKEIILNQLLEQVKGFSAMKVWRTVIYMDMYTIF
jgi:hypothetical protein